MDRGKVLANDDRAARESIWRKLTERIKSKLFSIGFREGVDYKLAGEKSTAYFINVEIKNIDFFKVELLRTLRGCLIEESSAWGCIVVGPVSSEGKGLLATVYDLAIVEGDGNAFVNEIIASAQLDCSA